MSGETFERVAAVGLEREREHVEQLAIGPERPATSPPVLAAASSFSSSSGLSRTERLSLAPDGRVLYQLRRPWRDGLSCQS